MIRFIRRSDRWRPCVAGVLALLFVSGSPAISRATRVVFRMFNLGETTAYTVERNDVPVTTRATTPLGVLTQPVEAASGDRIVLVRNDNLAPPIPPLFTSATARGNVCARLTWEASGDPDVVGYVVSYGVLSVANGQVIGYQYAVELGAESTYDVCGLGGSTYYFAVQSRNYAGQVSAYSAERSVAIQNEAALISQFDVNPGKDSVRLSWKVASEEGIRGYQVYRRIAGGAEQLITATMLPASADSYVDTDVHPGTTYTYVLAVILDDGPIRSAPSTATTPSYRFALEPNVPNPFRSATRIPFTLDAPAHVTVRIYDVRGALVATVFDGVLSEGAHDVGWGGHDMSGRLAATGTYFCALTAGSVLRSQKMILMR